MLRSLFMMGVVSFVYTLWMLIFLRVTRKQQPNPMLSQEPMMYPSGSMHMHVIDADGSSIS